MDLTKGFTWKITAGILAAAIFLSFQFARPTLETSPPPWGFFGHRKINRQAVFSLPPEMIGFFKKNIEYLTDHAVDPDMRRYASVFEAPRHFLDLDRYGKPPFPGLPRNWTDALVQYSGYFFVNENGDTLSLLKDGPKTADSMVVFNPALAEGRELAVARKDFRWFFIKNILPQYYEEAWPIERDSLARLLNDDGIAMKSAFAVDHFSEHGILPYHLVRMLERLTEAFQERDRAKILRHAADIGHYIADAHVPLHTTQNYNGQLTNQTGIHAFWESRLPELFADKSYDFWVGKASLIENPQEYFWGIVLKSHSYVDSVLLIEREIAAQLPPDQLVCNEMRGETMVKTQCEAFATAYHARMDGMVEGRMRDAILALSNAWYTAWMKAGQPDLGNLPGENLPPVDSAQMELEQAVKAGKPKGREHD